MITYASGMGVRPEWALAGEGEMCEDKVVDWHEHKRPTAASVMGR